MNRLSGEVKIFDFAITTERNGDMATAVSLPDTNPTVLVLRKCNVRSIFRQCKRIGVIAWGGPPDLTSLFDKVEFCYPIGNREKLGARLRDYNYFRSIFGECGCAEGNYHAEYCYLVTRLMHYIFESLHRI